MIKKIIFISTFLLPINLVNATSCEDALANSMGAIDREYFEDRHFCQNSVVIQFSLDRAFCLIEAELSWDQNTSSAIDAYNNC